MRTTKIIPPLKLAFDNDYRYVISKNPKIGYEILPNQRNKFNYYGEKILFWSNSKGLRDLERNYEHKTEKKRIVFLGDSVLMGSEFQIEKLPTVLLEKIFAKENEDVEVLNISYDGLNTEGEIELLKDKVNPKSIDALVINYVRNDTLNFSADLDITEKVVFNEFSHMIFPWIQRFLIFRWGIYFNQLNIQNNLINKQKNIYSNNIASGFKEIINLQKKYGFEVVIFIWPEFFSNNILKSCQDIGVRVDCLSKGELLVEKYAREVGLKTIRLEQYFLKKYKVQDIKTFITEDGMHPLNTKGGEVAEVFKLALKTHTKLLQKK